MSQKKKKKRRISAGEKKHPPEVEVAALAAEALDLLVEAEALVLLDGVGGVADREHVEAAGGVAGLAAGVLDADVAQRVRLAVGAEAALQALVRLDVELGEADGQPVGWVVGGRVRVVRGRVRGRGASVPLRLAAT